MSQTVLIVDDSMPLHKLVKAHLADEDLDLHSAYDGESALTMTSTLRPALILLDVDMPQLDGFEICRRLKANPATVNIPIVFLTGDSVVQDKVKGLDLGAADYVTKPFRPEELKARVRASLRNKQQIEQKAMVDGLTGLWNRTYLEQHLASQLSLAKRSGRPLACIMLEVDNLIAINQKHGSAAGEEILRSVSQIMLSQCRSEDAVCRCDGGKFAILLSGLTRAQAACLGDRLRSQIQRQLLRQGGVEMGVTCSIGVADTLVASDGSLLDRSDTALLRAKQVGRNCVYIARQAGDGVRSVA